MPDIDILLNDGKTEYYPGETVRGTVLFNNLEPLHLEPQKLAVVKWDFDLKIGIFPATVPRLLKECFQAVVFTATRNPLPIHYTCHFSIELPRRTPTSDIVDHNVEVSYRVLGATADLKARLPPTMTDVSWMFPSFPFIKLDDPDRIFYPGETVTGTINFFNPTPITMQSPLLLRWEHNWIGSEKLSGPKEQRPLITYLEKSFSPNYSLPFKFPIPRECPPSYEGVSQLVDHGLRIVYEPSWWFPFRCWLQTSFLISQAQ
ncbi:unnamed protein product [Caenorhabditis sp. 36 PRJEB53466]|nr:unnamed protein product [Caenorhabditis sp. 36 PRJEB53466]